MRMRQRFHDERGAVAVIVGLAMVVLLGMLALTVDLGRAVGIRRDMVNAADAASLAAAQECAAGNGPGAATSAANQTAGLNDTAATPVTISIDPECASGNLESPGLKKVTVTYSRVVDYFVAPVLGFDDVTIETTAAAVWGPAQGYTSPVPIRVAMGAVTACMAAGSGDACRFSFDNTDENSEAASQWGLLNFPEGWPPTGEVGPTDCSSSGGGFNDVIDYISPSGSPPAFDALIPEDPGYVYVCASPGEGGANLIKALQDRAQSEDPYLVFPVMDPTPPHEPDLTPGHESYPVVGFIKLRIVWAWWAQEADANCDFSSPPTGGGGGNGGGGGGNQSHFCVETAFDGGDVGGFLPGTGLSFGLNAVRLVE
jgi:Flp pilus assembly protein TadG